MKNLRQVPKKVSIFKVGVVAEKVLQRKIMQYCSRNVSL